MTSLYIKNSDTADPAREVADLLVPSKSAAVHNALSHRKRELEQVEATGIHVRMEARRRAHPTGEPTGMVADKAFYDSLNDEVDD